MSRALGVVLTVASVFYPPLAIAATVNSPVGPVAIRARRTGQRDRGARVERESVALRPTDESSQERAAR